MKAQKNDYAHWSERALRKAESAAEEFLAENGDLIGETFRAKVGELDALIESLHDPFLTLEERLNRFAQIAEISRLLHDDAQGFFSLASEPLVARILANVDSRPR
jgi:hypothetical protein